VKAAALLNEFGRVSKTISLFFDKWKFEIKKGCPLIDSLFIIMLIE